MIGVLGGMGPMATADFLKKLINATSAERDSDHIPFIAYSLPQIPDRTVAILDNGPSPLPYLISMSKVLKTAGADFGVIACNTAHHWYDDLIGSTDLEFIHIADAVSAALRQRELPSKKIGLMATPGTIASGFYQAHLARFGYDCQVSDDSGIELIHAGIKDVKANDLLGAYDKFMVEVEAFQRKNITTIILGCTELPLVLDNPNIFIDSNQALAEACVLKAFEKRASELVGTA
jgi:aspartate racemase